MCASPCWTRWRVGTKRNDSLINITRHPQTKTKDYGTTTKIQTRTLMTNASAAQVITGQGFWLWSRRVTTSHRVNCRPLLSKSVECQTSLTWLFLEHPLRMTESNVRSSGGPGLVLTGTQASSGKSGTVSADARVPCESAKCSSETDRGSANPLSLIHI